MKKLSLITILLLLINSESICSTLVPFANDDYNKQLSKNSLEVEQKNASITIPLDYSKDRKRREIRRINYSDYESSSWALVLTTFSELLKDTNEVIKSFPSIRVNLLNELLNDVDKDDTDQYLAYEKICNILIPFETSTYKNGECWIKSIKFGYSQKDKLAQWTNIDEAGKKSLRTHLRNWKANDEFDKDDYLKIGLLSHLHYSVYSQSHTNERYFITFLLGRRHIIE